MTEAKTDCNLAAGNSVDAFGMLELRIFISSPADVGSERGVTQRVAERLQQEFRGAVRLHVYLWERSLLRATDTFQKQILDIQQADFAAFILWSRLGSPLPDDYRRADGSRYASGTEYEFERARAGYELNGRPDILVYRKTADVQLKIRSLDLRDEQMSQLEAVKNFITKWFRAADDSFTGAFYEFETTVQFEELFEAHLKQWIQERLHKHNYQFVRRQWQESPYRGLEPFDFEHAPIFFGRTDAVTDIINSLGGRAQAKRAFVLVIGMSGAGKSSLVRAGVLPLLALPRVVEHVVAWRRAVCRPSDEKAGPLASLEAALLREHALPELAQEAMPAGAVSRTAAELTDAIGRTLARVAETARRGTPQAAPDSRARLVLVVDQFEEIFDDKVTAEDRAMFAETVSALARSGDVWVIATMRADFYARCLELPKALRELIERGGTYMLWAPRPADILQMIQRPATMAGLTFERRPDSDEALDQVLRDAAVAYPGALPLLEFTLDELWKHGGSSGTLRFADYEDLGGLEGALRQRAAEEFGRLPADARDALPTVLAALVRIEPSEDRILVRSRVPREGLDALPGCKALIDAFIKARLFVADTTPDKTPVVGLAHEALLREWEPAMEWIELNRDFLRLRGTIAAAVALWRANHESADQLLQRGALLRNAAKLLDVNRDILDREEQRFIEASLHWVKRRRRRQIYWSASAVLAVLVLAVGIPRLVDGIFFLRSVYEVRTMGPAVFDQARANAREGIRNLSALLGPSVAKIGKAGELVPWTVAEMSVALQGLDAAPQISAGDLRDFMRSHEDKRHCWTEVTCGLPHTAVTAWVVFAFARYGIPASEDEVNFLLGAQHAEGWWSMFPSTPDRKNSSTSATAWAALALHEQIRQGLVSPVQKEKVEDAVRRAAEWLKASRISGQARWKEYPFGKEAENIEYLAVSAHALHVLHQIDGGPLRDIDMLWLESLPSKAPTLLDSESAKGFVSLSAGDFIQDAVRHYRYPWMLRMTIDAFPSGTLGQKGNAARWINSALGSPLDLSELAGKDWIMAELLFSLRHFEDQAKSP